MLLVYGEMKCNVRVPQRKYPENFSNRRVLTHSTFTSTESVFANNNETGRHNDGTKQRENDILFKFKESPEICVRRLSSMYPISKSSQGNLLHKDNLYPFHFTKVQALLEGEFPARVKFAR